MINVFPQSDKWTPIEVADAVYSDFVSPYTGIVHSLHNQLYDEDDLPCYSIGARSSETREILGVDVNQLNGGGSTSLIAARVAAIGETLERYSGAFVPFEKIKRTAQLDPARERPVFKWPLFHKRQLAEVGFPYANLRPDTDTHWTRAWDLHTGDVAMVPADLVYLARLREGDTVNVAYATSNGLSCSIALRESLISSLFELLERHAFCLTWHAGLTPPRLNLEKVFERDPLLKELVSVTGLELNLFNVSELSGVPSVIAVVVNRKTDAAPISFGAAASSNIRRACRKATIEAFQTRSWIKAEQREGRTVDIDSNWKETVRNFDNHVQLFAGSKIERLFLAVDFLLSGRRVLTDDTKWDFIQESSPCAVLSELLVRCREQGFDLYYVDVTAPELKGRVSVSKILSPQLLQLDASYVGRFLGLPQLYGPLPWSTGRRTFEQLNSFPHPFP